MKFNLVDDVLRGISVEIIIKSNCWFKGLCFFWQDEENWLKCLVVLDDEGGEELCVIEERKVIFISLVYFIKLDINKVFECFFLWFQLKKCVVWIF